MAQANALRNHMAGNAGTNVATQQAPEHKTLAHR